MNEIKKIYFPCLREDPRRQRKGNKNIESAICIWIVVLFLILPVGCSVLKPIQDKNSAPDQPTRTGSAKYHNFDDILIPSQLKVNKRTSSIFETENLVAGVISLKGRMDIDALVEFFKNNMNKDNWSAGGMFKGPRSILLFEKGSRWCVITVTNGQYDTQLQVEIWVTPKSDEIASGLLK
jgi:hypothetical protein